MFRFTQAFGSLYLSTTLNDSKNQSHLGKGAFQAEETAFSFFLMTAAQLGSNWRVSKSGQRCIRSLIHAFLPPCHLLQKKQNNENFNTIHRILTQMFLS